MAAYFHGSSEIQADGLQTLYLMNPNYVGYSDTQQPTNMLFLNSATTGNGLTHPGMPHAPPGQAQHYVGIPLQAVGSADSDDHGRQSMHEIHGVIPRFHYNLWGSSGDQTATHIPTATPTSHSNGAADVGAHMGFRRPVVSAAQQGLSLSLSSQQPAGCRSLPCDQDLPMNNPVAVISPRSGENIRLSGGGGGGSPSSVSAVSNGIFGMQSMILGSKYLKAAQQLLDEVVNVGKRIKADTVEGTKDKAKMSKDSSVVAGETSSGGESSKNLGAEITAAQRQELQMKKAKLISILDEVEQRYRQYHQQMQIVVTSFEQASGLGSAKSYTSLALQTISKQFRCLKDAILGQIKATSKNLGEDQDGIGGKVEGSRLKFVDHHLRQQRAIQQLGMMQHNAWRPQRGLPERAVSVLRAWLFEHFLHPYPKDSDKHILAKQTGLTRSQVSNWFINARVRLWKPMVEEMYLEETKDQEQNANSETNANKGETSKDPAGAKSSAGKEGGGVQIKQISTIQSKKDNQMSQNASPTEISTSTVTTSLTGGLNIAQAGFALMGSANMERITQRSPKKPRNDMQQHSPSSILSVDMDMKPGETGKGINEKSIVGRQTRDRFPLIADTSSHGNGFGVYPIGELERFNPEHLATGFHGNGVSLTLGLPHCENLSLSGNPQSYLSNQNIQLGTRLEMGTVETHYNGINTPQGTHSNNGFDNINMQNRKRFAAQLLPDFVT